MNMKRVAVVVAAWSVFGCEATPPVPPPEPDHLAADIAKLDSDLLACMQRENDRLRAERDELDTKIAAARREAYELLAGATAKKPKGKGQ